MISNPFFLLSALVSSLFAFFTAAFIVEILIKGLRIRKYRVRAMLRLLPFFSMLIDLLFNQYSLAYWINPLSCASCIQKFFMEMFFPQLKEYLTQNQLSLINYLGVKYQSSFFWSIFMLVGAVSFFSVAKKIFHSIFLMKSLRSIAKRSTISACLLKSAHLSKALKNNKICVYLSHEIPSPVAIYPDIIIMPQKTIRMLSQEELEAVIAHELAHIQYRDPLVRLLYHVVAAFFWWVPTKTWIKKMEQEQELACDQSALQYDITGDSLASALCKVADNLKRHQAICYFTSSENFIVARIQDALGLMGKDQSPIHGMSFLAVAVGGLLLLMCVIYL